MCTAGRRGPARIIIASADSHLSNSRKRVLEQQGWLVSITRNKQHGLAMLHSDNFDVLILCDTLSSRAHVDFVSVFRESNPAGKVLYIQGESPMEVMYDATLPVPLDPAALVGTVARLLGL